MQLAKRVQEEDEILLGYQEIPALESEDTKVNPRDKAVPKTWDEAGLILLRGPPLHPELHQGGGGGGEGAGALEGLASKLEAAVASAAERADRKGTVRKARVRSRN